MFCHLLERFFDDVGAVPVTDNLCLSLMKTVRAEAPRVMVDPENYDARANVMWAGMLLSLIHIWMRVPNAIVYMHAYKRGSSYVRTRYNQAELPGWQRRSGRAHGGGRLCELRRLGAGAR